MSFDSRLLNGIGTFSAVVEAGSFVRAAVALGLTQSGVSRSIARLEARIGIRLFDRTTRVIALTDEGRRFYEQIVPLLSGIEEASLSASNATALIRGRLRVNMDGFFSQMVLAPKLKGFMEMHPELDLQLVTRDTLGDMVTDGFDIAVRFGNPMSSTLITRQILKAKIVTLASPSYLSQKGHPQHPDDLATQQHECIQFMNPHTKRPFEWEFHKNKKVISVPTKGRLTLTEANTLLEACLAGCGIVQLMEFGALDHIKNGRLIELFPDFSDERFPLYAYYPSKHLMPAKVTAFLDFISSLSRGIDT